MTKTKKWQCLICEGKRKIVFYKEKRLPDSKISPNETLCTGEVGSRGKHGRIWKCVKCGIIFQDPTFSDKELEDAYGGGSDERYFDQYRQRVIGFKRALTKVEKYQSSPGKLLDVGCNSGLFLHVAKESGWDVSGIDPSVWAARVAKKRFGIKIITGELENVKLPEESFDIITMWDVLEHYIDPTIALKKVLKSLKKDGTLALTTINIDSWFSKLLGRHWTWLIRIHLWYFNNETLVKMLEKTGYEVEWIGEQTRWFSVPYLLTRFTGWGFSWVPKFSLPAPTGDIVFAIARKKHDRV